VSREHYIIEVSIKRIYREPTGAQKYNSETRQNEPELGDRKHDEVIRLTKKAATLEKAIKLTHKHLTVELDEVMPDE
jgi:hypothetical protein